MLHKIDDINISKILVSKEEKYDKKNSFKYFIGYNDNDIIRPLCIKTSQITVYLKNFENSMTTSFKINSKEVLQKYNQIWKKIEKY